MEKTYAGDPPDDARPRARWHWMDGNVDTHGIRLDLRGCMTSACEASVTARSTWAARAIA